MVALSSDHKVAPIEGTSAKSLRAKPTNPRLTYKLAETFCKLVANAEISLPASLANDPELPPMETWVRWRKKHAWFREAWRIARESQAEHLAQKCLDLAREADPKNAHAQRLKFDVYRQMAKWLFPLAFGDKPDKAQTVNVGVVISQDSLSELRAKLENTRQAYRPNQEQEQLPAINTRPVLDMAQTPAASSRT